MNENSHLTDLQLRQLIEQTMDRRDIHGALRHIERCGECREKAAALAPAPTFVLVTPDPTPHLDADAMRAYLDGEMDSADSEIAGAHLEHCAACREDVAAVRREFGAAKMWFAAAAVIAIALIVVPFVSRRRVTPAQPKPQPVVVAAAPRAQEYANPEWTALVSSAIATKALPRRSDLADLRPVGDVLRGESTSAAAKVRPEGVVIDSTRPRLQWTAFGGATYTVVLQALDSSRIRRSPRLKKNEWVPDFDLRRGMTYEWQVEVDERGRSLIIPEPPAPRAFIHILEQSFHDDLVQARAKEPGDHLLLAVLDARAGLDDDARSELTLLERDAKTRQLAGEFLRSLSPQR